MFAVKIKYTSSIIQGYVILKPRFTGVAVSQCFAMCRTVSQCAAEFRRDPQIVAGACRRSQIHAEQNNIIQERASTSVADTWGARGGGDGPLIFFCSKTMEMCNKSYQNNRLDPPIFAQVSATDPHGCKVSQNVAECNKTL